MITNNQSILDDILFIASSYNLYYSSKDSLPVALTLASD